MTAQNLPKRGSNAKRKRGARQKAMQALYQWDFDREANRPEQVIRQFCEMQNMEKVDVSYFESLFIDAVENIDEIDTEISQHLDRELGQLDPIERSILRICCTELKNHLGTPYKVVVNEALEISKDFGADKGYRYINGIADKLAASLRSIEYNADHPSGNPLSVQTTEHRPARKPPASGVKVSMKEKTPESAAKAPAKTKLKTKPDSSAKLSQVHQSESSSEAAKGPSAAQNKTAIEPSPKQADPWKDKSGKCVDSEAKKTATQVAKSESANSDEPKK